MCASNSTPGYQSPSITGSQGKMVNMGIAGMQNVGGQQGLPQGQQLQDYAMGLKQNGLPQDIQNQYKGQLAGQKREGMQGLSEQFASQGNVPIGAQLAGQNQIAGQEQKGLQGLAGMNFNAKQSGFGDMSSLINQAMQLSEQQNQYNLDKYQIDQSNQFDIGGLLGGIGGSFLGPLGGMLGKQLGSSLWGAAGGG